VGGFLSIAARKKRGGKSPQYVETGGPFEVEQNDLGARYLLLEKKSALGGGDTTISPAHLRDF